MQGEVIDAQLAAARPRVLGALMRYFRDLDQAEDAFQEACLRALRHWPRKGPPRDPVSWLIVAGRNAGVDEARRRSRHDALPEDAEAVPDPDGGETSLARDLDERVYRDDVLRLCFICCHPDCAVEQQIALALRIVAGLTVPEIARAFLVVEKTMEQRITRAKRRIQQAGIPFATPTPSERTRRLEAVTNMVYLIFNEGYAASAGDAHIRVALCQEAIRLARLLLRLFPGQAEVMGLLALGLLQHARHKARLDPRGALVLLEDQDRALWSREMIEEGLVLVEKALRRGQPGPLQVQAAIAATHARAPSAEATDWAEIDRLYEILEALTPSPVVTLNRAVAVFHTGRPDRALAMIDPLADALSNYFHYHGVRGTFLRKSGAPDAAADALQRALELARTKAERDHIRRQLTLIENKS